MKYFLIDPEIATAIEPHQPHRLVANATVINATVVNTTGG